MNASVYPSKSRAALSSVLEVLESTPPKPGNPTTAPGNFPFAFMMLTSAWLTVIEFFITLAGCALYG